MLVTPNVSQSVHRPVARNPWMRRMFATNSRLQDYSLADVVNLVKAATLAEKVNALDRRAAVSPG